MAVIPRLEPQPGGLDDAACVDLGGASGHSEASAFGSRELYIGQRDLEGEACCAVATWAVERVDRHDLERPLVRGAEHHGGGDARTVGLEPARGADAPAVTRHEAGKPHSGCGVERSFPASLLKSRNSSVITAQTVWLPRSSGPVAQQPSR